VRNFGLTRSGLDARTCHLKSKSRDARIMMIAASGIAAVVFSIYALAFGLVAKRDVSSFLSFLP
jgi:hypothetical protein